MAVALLLSLVVPGLGQAYAGERLRAVLWFLAAVALGILSVDAMLRVRRPPFNLVLPLAGLFLYYLAELADSAWMAYRNRYQPRARWDRGWLWAAVLVPFVFVVEPAVTAVFERHGLGIVVPTDSMAPALFTYDCVMFNKRATTRTRGEVIAFQRPGASGPLIGRVTGVAGDRVPTRQGDTVTVPPVHVFVDVDNREDSVSFRGLLPAWAVIGRANVIYFSADPASGAVRWRRIGQPVR